MSSWRCLFAAFCMRSSISRSSRVVRWAPGAAEPGVNCGPARARSKVAQTAVVFNTAYLVERNSALIINTPALGYNPAQTMEPRFDTLWHDWHDDLVHFARHDAPKLFTIL